MAPVNGCPNKQHLCSVYNVHLFADFCSSLSGVSHLCELSISQHTCRCVYIYIQLRTQVLPTTFGIIWVFVYSSSLCIQFSHPSSGWLLPPELESHYGNQSKQKRKKCFPDISMILAPKPDGSSSCSAQSSNHDPALVHAYISPKTDRRTGQLSALAACYQACQWVSQIP